MTEVRAVADAAQRMSLSDPALAVRQADDEQLRAFRVVSKATDDVSTIRDVAYRLRIAQNARDADRAAGEYEDRHGATSAGEPAGARAMDGNRG